MGGTIHFCFFVMASLSGSTLHYFLLETFSMGGTIHFCVYDDATFWFHHSLFSLRDIFYGWWNHSFFL